MTALADRRLALFCLLATSLCAGCVQRRMTIRSSPPGAAVYVDDYQIGTTPVSHDFVYYGTRKIRLVKDGYETLTVRQPLPPPWYEYFPLDFVSENLIPWEIRDERVIDLPLAPAAAVPTAEVVARAEQVRLAAGSLPTAATGPSQAVMPAQPGVPQPVLQAPMQQVPMQPQPLPPPGPPPYAPGPPLGFPPQPQPLPAPPNQPTQGIPSLGRP